MKRIAVAIATVSLGGCFNLATPPSQITGAYVSPVKYGNYSCQQLVAENDSLARRENALVIAQEGRRKSSKVQAFWLGFGQGDGIEAAELANVKGDREAVISAMRARQCEVNRSAENSNTQNAAAYASAPTATGSQGLGRMRAAASDFAQYRGCDSNVCPLQLNDSREIYQASCPGGHAVQIDCASGSCHELMPSAN